ncbi:MAG TPA: hypothetical protein EYG81_06195 [Archaeoglobus profundus]|nr:hypothetical protein [Archaeoglobus profundus]
MMYNNKGVSVLIGFILILLALTMFLGFLQVHLVPALCKDVELKHENSLLYSLYTINENLIEGKSSLIVFNLEVHYPKYPFLLFPPSMGCTLAVDKFIINITYDVLLPNGTWINRKDSINTARLIIYLNYFYNKGYMLVFENTAVFKTNGDKFIVLSDQKMFENEINIVGLNPTFQSLSSTEAVEVWLKPISYGGYVVARNIKVEFESVCPDYWLRLNGYKGYSVSVNGSKVEISYSGTTILKISYFLLTRGQYSYKLEPYNIIPTNPTTNYTLGVNQSILLGVKVIDRYNNPVRGEEINVTVSNESVGNVDLNKVYTDVNGNAYVVFTSNSTGSTKVVFKLNNKSVVYNITVK